MPLTTSEQIRMVLVKKKMTIGNLADLLGQSRQNFSNKLSRSNFTVAELQKIADVLELRFEAQFIFPDGTKI